MAASQPKRVGIIGYGHLGQFLAVELKKNNNFKIAKIWNRTEDEKENVLPLTKIDEENLKACDLVIEVAHPDVVHQYASIILQQCNLFVGSPTALANQKTFDSIKELVSKHNRSVFVPAGAFWGSMDIQKMADLNIIKGLTVTMIKHPNSLKVTGPLVELNNKAKQTENPVILYDGPVRNLCSMAPNNVNTMAGAAIAAHTLGFDLVRAKLIADPQLVNWHIVEVEVVGENGFRTTTRRENPAAAGAVTGSVTYFSFLASVKETLYKPPGIHLC
ncbi:hypothetical protein QR680_011829 [Steinernema hermaphroditum]|uniref:Aspartate dehydrogenase domain-containing protein n=1 Tax=Steinernema hermaphroditum TaxID=289476 RepID=A0AA39LZM0_9BILA|nr:hypothetical protein QR680_011829 [Steinernema hermaphroditum]